MERQPSKKEKQPLDPEHAEWLVKNRGDNQVIAAKLYRLLKTYPEHTDKFAYETDMLVGVAFSLWRSVFLSDKTGHQKDTPPKAISFLAEMLENNAIVFSTERNANDWAFNYYAVNARHRLQNLQDHWSKSAVDMGPLKPPGTRQHIPKDRWAHLHDAFCMAVNHFEDLLVAAQKTK
jgi:hypothetical protein